MPKAPSNPPDKPSGNMPIVDQNTMIKSGLPLKNGKTHKR